MSRRAILSVISFASFILITLIVILLAQGYRLDRQTNTLYGTGIMVVSSDPTGAVLTLDEEVKGVTNSTINNLTPGNYSVLLEKEGYFPWSKEVEIEASKVLTVDALMIPVNPSLAPITSTPAQKTLLSPDGQKLAYTVTEGTSAGIWMLDLSSQPFNLGRKPIQLVADTDTVLYSGGTLQWSPSSKDLLITTSTNDTPSHYLVSIDNPQQTTLINQNVVNIRDQWQKEHLANEEELQSNFSEEVQGVISQHAKSLQWSPDNLKFLYFDDTETSRIYHVYDKEAKKTTKALEVKKGSLTVVRWYADSHHLMVLEKEKLDDTNGSVSLVGIDGSNKQQVFNGTLINDVLYTYLNGSKLVILTSFNLQEQTYYLYTINLR